jgi:hypothetical protein
MTLVLNNNAPLGAFFVAAALARRHHPSALR